MVRDSRHLYNPHRCSGTEWFAPIVRAPSMKSWDLEQRVLESLWGCASSVSVRELQGAFPALAYTTLMTTLDRLYRKGLLEREKDGRAFRYSPRYSRDALLTESARQTFVRMLDSGRAALRPVLSTLIDAVTEQDAGALDELERLVRERRTSEREKGGAS